MIPLLHTAISEHFRGAARDEALYKSTFTLLYFTQGHMIEAEAKILILLYFPHGR